MGVIPIMFTLLFIICGIGWYWLYSRGKIKREYALMKIIRNITNVKTDHILDEELREIMLDWDNVSEKRFENKLKDCVVLDLEHFAPPGAFSEQISKKLCRHLNISKKELHRLLLERERDSNILVQKGIAIITFNIKQEDKFDIALVRTKKGARFIDQAPPVHAVFIIISTPDEHNFSLHSLMWILQISESPGFRKKWMKAKTKKELRRMVLDIYRNQCQNKKKEEWNVGPSGRFER
jgi:mannitol/fructose-specific phosphotransferase system IIA component (Ntr-type)